MYIILVILLVLLLVGALPRWGYMQPFASYGYGPAGLLGVVLIVLVILLVLGRI